MLFSMAVGNVELVQECFHKHLRMEQLERNTTETEEVDKKRRVNTERIIVKTKKKRFDGLSVARASLPPG